MKPDVFLLLVGLVGCGSEPTIEVFVDGEDEVAVVEVVALEVWEGTREDGVSELVEPAVLPVSVSVPAGDYYVGAAQGTCSAGEEVTVADGTTTVTLSLDCVE